MIEIFKRLGKIYKFGKNSIINYGDVRIFEYIFDTYTLLIIKKNKSSILVKLRNDNYIEFYNENCDNLIYKNNLNNVSIDDRVILKGKLISLLNEPQILYLLFEIFNENKKRHR